MDHNLVEHLIPCPKRMHSQQHDRQPSLIESHNNGVIFQISKIENFQNFKFKIIEIFKLYVVTAKYIIQKI